MDLDPQRLQKACLPTAAFFAALWMLDSGGCHTLPEVTLSWGSLLLDALLAGVGALGGAVTRLRVVEIDQRRWEIVAEPKLTSGEREWAHKNAEHEIRRAGLVFLLPPLALGVWLGNHFHGDSAPLAAMMMAFSPILGFGLGLLWKPPRHDSAPPLQ